MEVIRQRGEWRCFIRESGEPYVMTTLIRGRQPLFAGKWL